MRVRGIPGITIYKPAARSGADHKWLIAYEEDGKRPVESVSTDLQYTQRYAREVSRRIEMKRLGLITPTQERFIHEGKRTFEEHLDDYLAGLRARGCIDHHVTSSGSHIRRVFQACSARFVHELSPSRVQRAIGTMRKLECHGLRLAAELLSAQSRNHYCTTIVCFFTWLKQDGRIAENPFAGGILRRFNVASDRKRVRRIITEQQLHELIRAADAGGVWASKHHQNTPIAGAVRGDVYRVCLATGLRYNEVATLTVADLRLDDPDGPCIRVTAKRAKNRRESLQPIAPWLAERCRTHVAGKASHRRVFALPLGRGAEMLRFDLAAAGIEYEDEQGRVFDFHALRYQSGSLMLARGENLKVIQQHMRHSTITLTMDRYAKLQVNDQAAAVGRLPQWGQPAEAAAPQQAKATGTDGREPDPSAPAQRSQFPRGPAVALSVPETAGSKTSGLRLAGAEVLDEWEDAAVAALDVPKLSAGFRNQRLSADPAPSCGGASSEDSATSDDEPPSGGAPGAQISAPGAAHAEPSKKIFSAPRRHPSAGVAAPAPAGAEPTIADVLEHIRMLAGQIEALSQRKQRTTRRGGRG